MSEPRYSRRTTKLPTVDPGERKFAAKRSNEMVKEAAAFLRGFALGVLVIGVLRALLDPAVGETSTAIVAASLLASVASEAAGIYMIRTL